MSETPKSNDNSEAPMDLDTGPLDEDVPSVGEKPTCGTSYPQSKPTLQQTCGTPYPPSEPTKQFQDFSAQRNDEERAITTPMERLSPTKTACSYSRSPSPFDWVATAKPIERIEREDAPQPATTNSPVPMDICTNDEDTLLHGATRCTTTPNSSCLNFGETSTLNFAKIIQNRKSTNPTQAPPQTPKHSQAAPPTTQTPKIQDLPQESSISANLPHPLSHLSAPVPKRDPDDYRKLKVITPTSNFPRFEGTRSGKDFERLCNVPQGAGKGTMPIYRINNLRDVCHLQTKAVRAISHYERYDQGQVRPIHDFTNAQQTQDNHGTNKPRLREDGTIPVLYQVVGFVSVGVLLEARHLETFVGRPELRYLVIDKFCLNTFSGKRGIFSPDIEVKDLFYVEDVDMRWQLLNRHSWQELLTLASDHNKSIKDITPCFRAAKFLPVPPPTLDRCLLYVQKIRKVPEKDRSNYRRTVTVVVQHCPFFVTMSGLKFRTKPIEEGLFLCTPRADQPPVTYSTMYPNSQSSFKKLTRLLRETTTALPPCGVAPIEAMKLPSGLWSAICDRMGTFRYYASDKANNYQVLSQSLAMGTAILEAHQNSEIDFDEHPVTVLLDKVRLDTLIHGISVISNKSLDGGYTKGQSISVKFGTNAICCLATIDSAAANISDDTFTIQFSFYPDDNPTLKKLAGDNLSAELQAKIRLLPAPPAANPIAHGVLKNAVSRIPKKSTASEVLDIVYGSQDGAAGTDSLPFPSRTPDLINIKESVVYNGKRIQLTEEQRKVIAFGTGPDNKVLAIQAPFGSGKTFVAALLACELAETRQEDLVLLTASTNTAVSKAVNAVLQLESTNKIAVHRFLSDRANMDSPKTEADLRKRLMNLENDYGSRMTSEDRALCLDYQERRRIIEDLWEGKLHTEEERERAEQAALDDHKNHTLLRKMVELLQKFEPTKILACTNTTAINLLKQDGLFNSFSKRITCAIVDEGSQVSDAVLGALLHPVPNARIVVTGDVKQLRPFSRTAARLPTALANRGLLSVCLHADASRKVLLTESFRSHPLITDLVSRMFYGSTLNAVANPEERAEFLNSSLNLPNKKVPMLLLLTAGMAQRVSSKSLINEDEVRTALEICKRLKSKFSKEQIAVICLYRAQCDLARRLLRDLATVSTADSSQGSEFEVALILTTRSSAGNDENPFFEEGTRINVCLTRARQGFMVLGNREALQGTPGWENYVREMDQLSARTSLNLLLS